MDYWKLITDAAKLTYRYKFLWGLGILAATTEGNVFSTLNYSLPSFDKTDGGGQPPLFESVQTAFIKGASSTFDSSSLISTPAFLISIFLVFLIIFLIILFLSFSAKAGLIQSVVTLENQKPFGFVAAFFAGRKLFWRVLGLELLLFLIVILSIFLLILPAVFFVMASQILLAILWAIVLILPLILFFIYLGLLEGYGLRILVLENKRVLGSVAEASRFLKNNLKDILIVWLLAIVLGIIISLSYLIILLFLGIPLLALGFLIYLIASWTGVLIYAIIFGLLLIVFLLILSGIVSAFTSSYWTLSYLRIKEFKSSKIPFS